MCNCVYSCTCTCSLLCVSSTLYRDCGYSDIRQGEGSLGTSIDFTIQERQCVIVCVKCSCTCTCSLLCVSSTLYKHCERVPLVLLLIILYKRDNVLLCTCTCSLLCVSNTLYRDCGYCDVREGECSLGTSIDYTVQERQCVIVCIVVP